MSTFLPPTPTPLLSRLQTTLVCESLIPPPSPNEVIRIRQQDWSAPCFRPAILTAPVDQPQRACTRDEIEKLITIEMKSQLRQTTGSVSIPISSF